MVTVLKIFSIVLFVMAVIFLGFTSEAEGGAGYYLGAVAASIVALGFIIMALAYILQELQIMNAMRNTDSRHDYGNELGSDDDDDEGRGD